MNPYTLSNTLQNLVREVEDGGEIGPELLAQLEALEADRDTVIENYCKLVSGENKSSILLRQEAAVMLDRARHHDKCMVLYRDALLALLQKFGIDRIKTGLFTVSVQTSPPRTLLRAGVETGDLSPEYVRVTEEPNLQKLFADYKLGVLADDMKDKIVVESDNKHVKIQPR